jgi:hypothetical protein
MRPVGLTHSTVPSGCRVGIQFRSVFVRWCRPQSGMRFVIVVGPPRLGSWWQYAITWSIWHFRAGTWQPGQQQVGCRRTTYSVCTVVGRYPVGAVATTAGRRSGAGTSWWLAEGTLRSGPGSGPLR